MITLLTRYHGEISYKDEEIIYFEKGLPAFENEKQFIILPLEEGSSFFILQSVLHSHIAFAVIDVFQFFPNYTLDISNELIEQLEIKQPEDIITFVMLSLQESIELTTANLLAPLLINVRSKKGRQFVRTGTDYKTKHSLMER